METRPAQPAPPTQPALDIAKCGICWETMNTGENGRSVTLPCGHVFDKMCLDRWLTGGARTCPRCARAVTAGDVIPLYLEAPVASGTGISADKLNDLLAARDGAFTHKTETRNAYKEAAIDFGKAHDAATIQNRVFERAKGECDRAIDLAHEARDALNRARAIPNYETLYHPDTKLEDMPAIDEQALTNANKVDIDAWKAQNAAIKAHNRANAKRLKADKAREVARVNMLKRYRTYREATEIYEEACDAVTRAVNCN